MSTEVRRSVDIRAPLDAVWSLLTEPERLPELHPYIDAVRVDSRAPDPAGGERVEFTVDERVTLAGPLRVPNRYTCTMLRDAADRSRVEFTARSRPGVTVRHRYALREAGDGRVRVEQGVSIDAPLYVRALVVRLANRAHEATLKALRERLER